jgi:hypothetical protein
LVLRALAFGYEDDGAVVFDLRSIYRRFLQQPTSVIVRDICLLFPFDWILLFPGIPFLVLPLVRLPKLLQTARLPALSQHFEHCLVLWGLRLSFELSRIVKLSALMFETCHLAGCLWVFAAHLSTDVLGYERNWIIRERTEEQFSIPAGATVEYLRSIYWALSGMSTSGMPDVLSTNPVEMIMCILVLFFGCQVLMALIGSIASLMGSLHRKRRYSNLASYLIPRTT